MSLTWLASVSPPGTDYNQAFQAVEPGVRARDEKVEVPVEVDCREWEVSQSDVDLAIADLFEKNSLNQPEQVLGAKGLFIGRHGGVIVYVTNGIVCQPETLPSLEILKAFSAVSSQCGPKGGGAKVNNKAGQEYHIGVLPYKEGGDYERFLVYGVGRPCPFTR